MSRTFRVNKVYSGGRLTEQNICSDGKQRWKCKCSYCLQLEYKRALDAIHNKEINDTKDLDNQ